MARTHHRAYPFSAWAGAQPGDWIYWQAKRDIRESALAPYLNRSGPEVCRCPSDDVESHWVIYGAINDVPQPYRYSYIFNARFDVRYGHVDFVTREFTWDYRNCIPEWK